MYLCRDILGTSYPQLGQLFGGKDHSTVIYSIKKIEEYLLMHNNVHKEITEIKNMCLQKDH
jgi:chromosomal replication initiator protein